MAVAASTHSMKALITRAEAGDVLAALELANTYRCEDVEELLGVVCPLAPPSVEVFDVCADAMSLKQRRDGKQ